MSQFPENDEAVGEDVDDVRTPASADLRDQAEDAETIDVDAAAVQDAAEPEQDSDETESAPEVDYEALVAERTADLQRLQAEYVNYKKRVDRDRGHAKRSGVEQVVIDLLPVLDAIQLAEQHNDLAEGGRMIIDELYKVTTKHGLETFGAVGEAFDPVKHEALMQVPAEEPVEVVTITQVIQPGYALQGRVIRPARVAVANP